MGKAKTGNRGGISLYREEEFAPDFEKRDKEENGFVYYGKKGRKRAGG